MRILLLSDIHANLEALEACLAAAPAYDIVVNLGDVVGYGASPNEVVERSISLGRVFIRGNHDKAVSGEMDLGDFNPMAALAAHWTRNQLTAENLEWLRQLPKGPAQIKDLPGVQFVHGSPVDEDEYVVVAEDAIEPLVKSAATVTFYGHTHMQGAFSLRGASADALRPVYQTVGQPETCEFPLKDGTRYMVNPGSVGQPRDGDWRAAFAVYDSESRIITYCRAPYDLRTAQERIFSANLPHRLGTRLAAGR